MKFSGLLKNVAATLVLASPLLLSRDAAGQPPAGRNGTFEKTIPLPRTGEARLGWAAGGCSVRAVSLRNYPSSEDIEKARKDPDEKDWLWWDFHVDNRSSSPCRIAIVVDVYDRSGSVVKSSDKSDTVDEHKVDDNIRISTRMRTIDIVNAPHARIRVEIGPK